MDNYLAIVLFTLAFIGVFTTVTMVGDEVIDNKNLDSDSRQMLFALNFEKDRTFNRTDYQDTQFNISENASFEGVDAFSRDFLETQAAGQAKTSTLQRIFRIPDLIITAIGIPESFVGPIKAFILTVIGIFVGVATFNLIRRGKISSA